MFSKTETTALFVDGVNFFSTARALGFDVNYGRLLECFQAQGRVRRACYFTPIADSEDHVALRPLIDWLQYNGWTVTAKPVRTVADDDGRRRMRGNTDIELTVAALKLAPMIDHAVLFSGKADFLPLITYLKDLGVRVTVVSTMNTPMPMIADDLRRQADHFIDLADLQAEIRRPPLAASAA